ncbi:hypothetical protein AX15_004604 [Amanita polypyramis BW_CC]|nr:hypothetical protein AX15_004604 [Amanita polypyramis BW_CC]
MASPLLPAVSQCHPLFSSPHADTVLCSQDGTLYRLPSFLLRESCGHFHQILSHDQLDVPIPVPESDRILERFLCMISGLEVPVWKSFDEFEGVLALAEAWEAPGPMSFLRSSVTSPLFLQDPIRLYGLTSRLQWDEEKKIASMFTLPLPILDEGYLAQLQRLPSKELLDLLLLRRARKDQFRNLIDVEGSFDFCPRCATEINDRTWRVLKLRMVLELDKWPLGDTLMELLDESPEALDCWNARCATMGCGRLNYDKVDKLREIRTCLEQLPSTV